MDYFPAFLDLDARNCLLVGAGAVATRKARLLLDAGAQLKVVAPEIDDAMSELVREHGIDFVQRAFRPSDVDGQWLVVAATAQAGVQRQVRAAADAARVFCNSVDDVANSSYITPAIVDRGPVVVAVSSGGAAPVLARKIRARVEALLPAETATMAEVAREWRDRVADRIRDAFSRRRFWERVFDRKVTSHDTMSRLLEEAERAAPAPGRAWLVGAGPGDPELLTLRALQVMHEADVILHDRLVSDDVLALARRDAERIPVGKTPGSRRNSQEEINELLVSLVAAGKRVCRLKGGDPFIFGRGGEEAQALAEAGLACDVVPGITAAAGCAAYAGIPLTHRDASQSVVLITGHGKNSVDRLDWPSLARDRQTLAVYMAVKRFGDLMNKLIGHGRRADTPIAIVENGTTDDQRVIRGSLGQLTLLAEAHQVAAPAMLIIGEVAQLGQGNEQSIRGTRDDLRQYSADHR